MDMTDGRRVRVASGRIGIAERSVVMSRWVHDAALVVAVFKADRMADFMDKGVLHLIDLQFPVLNQVGFVQQDVGPDNALRDQPSG